MLEHTISAIHEKSSRMLTPRATLHTNYHYNIIALKLFSPFNFAEPVYSATLKTITGTRMILVELIFSVSN